MISKINNPSYLSCEHILQKNDCLENMTGQTQP